MVQPSSSRTGFKTVVEPILLHYLDYQWVNGFSGFQSRTFNMDTVTGKLFQVGFGDLAAATIMLTNEEHV
jgi:hypothetical protein